MSWKIERIGSLLKESRVPAISPDSNKRIRVRLNVAGVEKRPFENEIAGATKQFIRKSGQFIYGRQNFHKGAFGIVPAELDGFETSADIPSFDIRHDCLPEWIFYFFKSGNRYLELEKLARGVGSKRIHPEQLADIEIPIPPIEEQKLYILKLKKIERNFAEQTAEILSQLDLLKKFHQQILKDAVQGKLVPQDPNDEPASILLEKIKAEKQKLIAEGKLKKDKALPPIKPEEIPFKIPENWVWCKLGDILTEIKYGTSKSCDYNSIQNSCVLRIPNVSSGILNGEDLKYTNLSPKEKVDLSLEKDDILIIRSNGSRELVGKTVIVTDNFVGFSYAGYLVRLRFNKKFLNPQYVLRCSHSPFFRERIETPLRTTVGINNINSTEISELPIPLPPIQEQKRIAIKIKQLNMNCDELERIIQQNQKYTQELLQVALKEALEPRGD